jgi:hypothetical protein
MNSADFAWLRRGLASGAAQPFAPILVFERMDRGAIARVFKQDARDDLDQLGFGTCHMIDTRR